MTIPAVLSLMVNYSQQLTSTKKMEIIPNLLPATEKEFNRKQQTNPFLPLPHGPGDLEDRGGSELLVPFVQKPLFTGGLACPRPPLHQTLQGRRGVRASASLCFVLLRASASPFPDLPASVGPQSQLASAGVSGQQCSPGCVGS